MKLKITILVKMELYLYENGKKLIDSDEQKKYTLSSLETQ